jgi:dihydroorotate dehydrogenase electron transfer subunit
MGEIINNQKIAPNIYKLDILAPEISEKAQAGQFVHIKLRSDNLSYDPLLRRPFSIHDIDRGIGIITLIYRVVGRGSNLLSKYMKGEELDILGPLGRGFQIQFSAKNIFIIGGGMGIVPLYFLTRELKNNNIKLFLGGANREEMNYFSKIFTFNNVELNMASIDGSIGFKGTVIDLLREKYNVLKANFLYSCGPKKMLIEVQKLAKNNNIPGELSLEERMGCGIGVCLSCICKTIYGNKRVCKEGPVFPIDEVILNES